MLVLGALGSREHAIAFARARLAEREERMRMQAAAIEVPLFALDSMRTFQYTIFVRQNKQQLSCECRPCSRAMPSSEEGMCVRDEEEDDEETRIRDELIQTVHELGTC